MDPQALVLDISRKRVTVTMPAFYTYYYHWLKYVMGMTRHVWLFEILSKMRWPEPETEDAFVGAGMRSIFSNETGYEFAGMPRDWQWDLKEVRYSSNPVTVAEVMCGVAVLMSELDEYPRYNENDIVSHWTWLMLDNMRITEIQEELPLDAPYDVDVMLFDSERNGRVYDALDRWLNRKYTRYGVGGPFPVRPDKTLPNFKELDTCDMARIYLRTPVGRRYHGR